RHWPARPRRGRPATGEPSTWPARAGHRGRPGGGGRARRRSRPARRPRGAGLGCLRRGRSTKFSPLDAFSRHGSTIVIPITEFKDPKCGSKELDMGALPAGRHFFRGDEGYEAARCGTVWHQRVPERYPDAIVQAVDADDIVAGLRYAKANGHHVSIVSG